MQHLTTGITKLVDMVQRRNGKLPLINNLDGSTYEGEWLNGKYHGQGIFTWPDGDRFEGDYRDGKKHGRGIKMTSKGTRYEGDWLDDNMHGRGIMTWANKDRYEWEFSENTLGLGADGYARGSGKFTSGHGGWTYLSRKEACIWPETRKEAVIRPEFAAIFPREGELVEADGRRFKVTFADGCCHILGHPGSTFPTPTTKEEMMAPWPAAPSGAGGHMAGAAGGAQGGQAQLRSSRAGGKARGGGTKAEVNLDSLNVNELKEILKSRGIVDFGDCFEKSDLIAKIKTLGNYANVDVAGGGVDVSAAGWAETPGADSSKRKAVYDTLFCPRELKFARNDKGVGAEGACGKRPDYNKQEIEQHVNVLYLWEWRTVDGTYLAFDKDQNIKIETCFRQGNLVARLADTQLPVFPGETRKYFVDFHDMTVQMGGDSWATAIRRWDIKLPMDQSWDHQVDNLLIVDVETQSRDYKVVETAFFNRERKDKKVPRISQRTHTITRVRRVQNRALLTVFQAQRNVMEQKRGKDKVELTRTYAWHGSGKTCPDEIASGKGFLVQYGNSQGFYQQGTYTAEQASYSHHERYVYRSNDVEGSQPSGSGKYFHLLLVNVLRGNPLKTSDVWRGTFADLQEKLGQEFDSVEGGPHRPLQAGPGTDDSIIYVVYEPSLCLPEFIVTYTEDSQA